MYLYRFKDKGKNNCGYRENPFYLQGLCTAFLKSREIGNDRGR